MKRNKTKEKPSGVLLKVRGKIVVQKVHEDGISQEAYKDK